MRSFRMLVAGLATAIGLSMAGPASAGGWERGDDEYYARDVYVHHYVYAPRYVHVYHVHRPAPRYVHVIGYEQAPYDEYRYAAPYRYGAYWSAPYYRSYYPVRTVYPRPYRHRHHYMK